MSVGSSPGLPTASAALSPSGQLTQGAFTLAANPVPLPPSPVAIAQPSPFEQFVTPPAGQGVTTTLPEILPKLSDGVSPIFLQFTTNGGTWGNARNEAEIFAQNWNTKSPQEALRRAPSHIRSVIASNPGLYGNHPGHLNNPTLQALAVPLVHRDQNGQLAYASTVVFVPATQVPSYIGSLQGISKPALPKGSVEIFDDYSIATNSGINGFTLSILQHKEQQYYSQRPIDQQPAGTFALNLPQVDPTGQDNTPPQMIGPDLPPGLQQTERGTLPQQVVAGVITGLDGPGGANRNILETLANANIPGLSGAARHQLQMRDQLYAELMQKLGNPAGGVVDLTATITYGGQTFTLGALLGIAGATTGGAITGGTTWGALGGGALGVTAQGVLDGSIKSPEEFGKALAFNLLTDAAFFGGLNLLGDALTVAQIPRALDDLAAGRPATIAGYDLRRAEGGRLEVKPRSEPWQTPLVDVEARPVADTPATNQTPEGRGSPVDSTPPRSTGDVGPVTGAPGGTPPSNGGGTGGGNVREGGNAGGGGTRPPSPPAAGAPAPEPDPIPGGSQDTTPLPAPPGFVLEEGVGRPPVIRNPTTGETLPAVDTVVAPSPAPRDLILEEAVGRSPIIRDQATGEVFQFPDDVSSAEAKSFIDTLRQYIDVRVGISGQVTNPIDTGPLLRASVMVGIDSFRLLWAQKGELATAVRTGDFEKAHQIVTQALGLGLRVGEGYIDPQFIRSTATNGIGSSSIIQFKVDSLGNFAQRSVRGEASPFIFNADPEKNAISEVTPPDGDPAAGTTARQGTLTGRLSLNVTEVELAPNQRDAFGNVKNQTTNRFYRLNAPLVVDKVLREYFVGSLSFPPGAEEPWIKTPGAEYREESNAKVTLDAGTVVPEQFVRIMDRRVGSVEVSVNFRLPTDESLTAADLGAFDRSGSVPRDPNPGIAVGPTATPILDASTMSYTLSGMGGGRISSVTATKLDSKSRNLDVTFFPLENLVNKALETVTGTSFPAMARSVPGVSDMFEALVPNDLNGYASKERFKVNALPLVQAPGIGKGEVNLYVVREALPDMRTGLMTSRTKGEISVTGQDGETRVIEVPQWFAVMFERQAGLFGPTVPRPVVVVPPGGSDALKSFLKYYVDYGTPEQKAAAMSLQEELFNGPKQLFKDGTSLTNEVRDRILGTFVDLLPPRDSGQHPSLNERIQPDGYWDPNGLFSPNGSLPTEDTLVGGIGEDGVGFPSTSSTGIFGGEGTLVANGPSDVSSGLRPTGAPWLTDTAERDLGVPGVSFTGPEAPGFTPANPDLGFAEGGSDLRLKPFAPKDFSGVPPLPPVAPVAPVALTPAQSAATAAFQSGLASGTAPGDFALHQGSLRLGLTRAWDGGELPTRLISPTSFLQRPLTPAETVFTQAFNDYTFDRQMARGKGLPGYKDLPNETIYAGAIAAGTRAVEAAQRRQTPALDLKTIAASAEAIAQTLSPELATKMNLFTQGYILAQNTVNFDQKGAPEKALAALTQVIGLDASAKPWVDAVQGAYKIGQNAMNGAGGFQDGGATAVGLLQGTQLVLGSGLLGRDGQEIARFIGTGLRIDHGFKLANGATPNPVAGYATIGSAILSLIPGDVGNVGSNLLSTVANAALLSSNPLTAVPGLILSGFGLVQSLIKAFGPNYVTISKNLDVSDDGQPDTVRGETKQDDIIYDINGATNHVDIRELGFSLRPAVTPLVKSSGENSEETITDPAKGAQVKPGRFTLTLNGSFQMPMAPASVTSEGVSTQVELDANQVRQLFGADALDPDGKLKGPLSGKLIGSTAGGGDDAKIAQMRPFFGDRKVSFVQTAKNEGVSHFVDWDGNGTRDHVTMFPKIDHIVGGDSSSVVRLRTPDGRVYASFAYDRDGAASTDSRAAQALSQEPGSETMVLGQDGRRGVVKVDYNVLASMLQPEEKMLALAYAASNPGLADALMQNAGGVTGQSLDLLAAKAFWHMSHEAPKHNGAYKIDFDPLGYLAAHPDLAQAFAKPGANGATTLDLMGALQHWLTIGRHDPRRAQVPVGPVGGPVGGPDLAVDIFGGAPAGQAPAAPQGSANDDQLAGGSGADSLQGLAGYDSLWGGAGPDSLEGGRGDDALMGGKGRDALRGGEGWDQLFGQAGHDGLWGGAGDDALLGGRGADSLHGQAGHDRLWGGAGQDSLWGGQGFDRLFGERGADTLLGGQGDDTLLGGAGLDQLFGQAGEDLLLGGKGADQLFGGKDHDRVLGQQGHDQVAGNRGWDEVQGGKGDDVVQGGKGNDQVFGGQGNDVVAGDRGDDTVDGGAGFDTAAFSGRLEDYEITREGDGLRIRDKRADGQGSDRVTNVEAFQFAGGRVSLEQLLAQAS